MAKSDNNVKISVVMPALNEEKNIADAITAVTRDFKKYGLKGEIVVVNDGSSDTTPGIVKKIQGKESGAAIKLINHDRPMGIGSSFWDGVNAAQGEIVTMLPGDNENDPQEILRYLHLMEDIDIVIPFVFNRNIRSPFRKLVSFTYRSIINLVFGVNFNYTNGTVLYRRCILNDLVHKANGFFYQTEILVKLAKRGYLFAEVPYKLNLRQAGVSKALTFASFLKVVRAFLTLFTDIYFGQKRDLTLHCDSMSAQRRLG